MSNALEDAKKAVEAATLTLEIAKLILCAIEGTGSAKMAEIRGLVEKHKIPVDSTDGDGKTAFYHACAAGNLEVAKLLLELEANINHRCLSPGGWTPLGVAAWCGRDKIVEWLLQQDGIQKDQLTSGEAESPIYLCRRGRKAYEEESQKEERGYDKVEELLAA